MQPLCAKVQPEALQDQVLFFESQALPPQATVVFASLAPVPLQLQLDKGELVLLVPEVVHPVATMSSGQKIAAIRTIARGRVEKGIETPLAP
jgi:hypothetical protein